MLIYPIRQCGDAYENTEFYIVKSRLGNIRVSDLSVSEGENWQYTNIGKWDSSKSFDEKAYKCGIIDVDEDHKEICWGISQYGKHCYIIKYNVTNLIKSLNDFDMIHHQFISPKLSSAPEHIRLNIKADSLFHPRTALDSSSVKAWGFGFEGKISYNEDGSLSFESTKELEKENSLIALIRFDKGIFESSSKEDRDFAQVLEEAQDEESDAGPIAIVIGMIALFVIGIKYLVLNNQKNFLGTTKSKIPPSKEVPFGGDIIVSNFVLENLEGMLENRIVQAVMTKLLMDKCLSIKVKAIDDKKDKYSIELGFTEHLPKKDSPYEEFYNFMKEASSDGKILRDTEFKTWAEDNSKRLTKWFKNLNKYAQNALKTNKWGKIGQIEVKMTPEGQCETRKLVGLKKHLKNCEGIEETDYLNDKICKDHLLFAIIFGYAKQLIRQFETLGIKHLDNLVMENNNANIFLIYLIICSNRNSYSSAITNTVSASSGSTSIGGGGGFSGGGAGGGAR